MSNVNKYMSPSQFKSVVEESAARDRLENTRLAMGILNVAFKEASSGKLKNQYGIANNLGVENEIHKLLKESGWERDIHYKIVHGAKDELASSGTFSLEFMVETRK